MTMRSRIRKLFGRQGCPSVTRPRARLRLEALEDRLAPAVQLLYGGPGTVLSLLEQVSGATPAVTIAEPKLAPGKVTTAYLVSQNAR